MRTATLDIDYDLDRPALFLREPGDHRTPSGRGGGGSAGGGQPTPPDHNSKGRMRWPARLRLVRQALFPLPFKRILKGGRIADLGRLPRYAVLFGTGFAAIWVPIALYLMLAPAQYASEVSLILPGTGAQTSINLSDIGQASSSSASAYASSSLSPTVTYKNLLEGRGVIESAAKAMHMDPHAFGKPTIKLVDETSLIHLEMTGATPRQAQQKTQALLTAFLQDLDHLRDDEISRRNDAAAQTIRDYQASVNGIRAKIDALQLESGLTSADQYASIVASAETLQAQVAQTEAALREKDGSVQSLSGLLKVSPQVAAVSLKVQADPEMAGLTDAVSRAAATSAELEKQFGPNHPKALDAHAKEMGIRARMVKRGLALSGLSAQALSAQVDPQARGERPALMARLVGTVVERQGLAAQLASERAELAARRRRVHDLVDTGSKLDLLNRDYKVADAVFASALARVNTSKADIFASYPMVQIAEPATLPTSKSSPSVVIAAAAGVAATIFLALGLALTWLRQPLIGAIVKRVGSSDEDG